MRYHTENDKVLIFVPALYVYILFRRYSDWANIYPLSSLVNLYPRKRVTICPVKAAPRLGGNAK